MESGVPVIHTQLVSGLCLCWEGEMSCLSARFWQGKGKARILILLAVFSPVALNC